ncbi:MAG: LuxR C-terminal-related transcriptional regulator, partial [Candidatus Promineifilaceae bacterium]
SDIYSLGVTLYELLTGRHPYPGHSSVERLFRHINDPLPEIADLGEEVNEVLRKATSKNPAQRYTDALEMAAAFRQAAHLDQTVDSASVVETLTPREQQILALIVEGRTNRQIAQELFIELSTVKWYISQIYRKLGVRSRVQAMVRARELRLVVPGSETAEPAARSTSVSIALPEPANPYKGLKAFEAADSRDFFGREALIEHLIADLEGDQGRFLAVVGPSGSGKSSLVKAGLIPAIWRGALPGSERWFVVEMAPGARPLDELEVALTRVAANQSERLHEQLRRDENGLLRVAGLVLPNDGSELVLIIDQFEELFTLVEREEERLYFLHLLQRAVSDPRSRVRVVIALRADFYHRPLQYPEFGELVRGQMETVLPLSAVELERAIVRPAEGAGARFEEGLVPTIIEDVRYQPGGLPLMQYALTELFDRREGLLLTGDAYEAIGGIAGALAGRAESLYRELDPEGQETVRQLFLQLTTVEQSADDGQTAPLTRRRVARSELQAVAGDAELMDDIIDTYAAYRLLSLDHDPATRRPTVEVAHEAILDCWERLHYWLEESRDDLRQRRRLERLAGDWQDARRDPSFLLSGTQLDLFVDWAAETDLALTAVKKDYLAANLDAREERLAEEEARQRQELETAQQLAETERARAQAEQKRAEEQTRTSRRLRMLAAGLAALLLAAAGFALLAVQQAQRADEQARLATARALGALALSNITLDPERSILLGLEAAAETYEEDRSVLPEVEETLHRAIQSSRAKFTLPQGGGLDFTPDGKRLATSGADGTITIWDPASGEKLQILSGHIQRVSDLTFSPNGKMLASVSNDFQRIVW